MKFYLFKNSCGYSDCIRNIIRSCFLAVMLCLLMIPLFSYSTNMKAEAADIPDVLGDSKDYTAVLYDNTNVCPPRKPMQLYKVITAIYGWADTAVL